MEKTIKPLRVHFIGVGGISMSALAKWCLARGYAVSGSDSVHGRVIDELCDGGIYAYTGHNPTVAATADTVVYTSAISGDNAELCAAREAGVPVYERHIFLGRLAEEFQSVAAVSGTHGKTTTTSLIASVMKNAGLPFTAHIGGEASDVGGNFYTSGDKILVSEACEYRRHFLSLYPDVAVILNIESDHPDYFGDIDELYAAFAEFLGNVHKDGFIVVFDNVDYSKLHICKNAHILKFGFDEASDVRAVDIEERNGMCEYDLFIKGEYYARVRPNLTGKHNILNVLAAVAVCYIYGIDRQIIVNTLNNFSGVKRRFEKVGELNGANVIVDYAHHPSEISATIDAARDYSGGNVRVYFQPHTYSRTAKYFLQFTEALAKADEVNFLPTYPARETPDKGRSSFELFYYMNANVKEAKYFENFVDASANVLKTARPNDVIILMGAGDVNEMEKLLIVKN